MFILNQMSEGSVKAGFCWAEKSALYCGYKSFQNECYLVAQAWGVQAAELVEETLDTALLAHKVLRLKRFYHESGEYLVKRIFSATARKLMRIQSIHDYYSVHLTVLCMTEMNWWLGTVGQFKTYYVNQQQLAPISTDFDSRQPVLGETKHLDVAVFSGRCWLGNKWVICTPDLVTVLNEKRLANWLVKTDDTRQTPQLAKYLVDQAQKRRRHDNFGVLVVEKSANN